MKAGATGASRLRLGVYVDDLSALTLCQLHLQVGSGRLSAVPTGLRYHTKARLTRYPAIYGGLSRHDHALVLHLLLNLRGSQLVQICYEVGAELVVLAQVPRIMW